MSGGDNGVWQWVAKGNIQQLSYVIPNANIYALSVSIFTLATQ